MPEPARSILLTVNGALMTVAPGTTVAAAVAMAAAGTRTSVSGDPRGPLCGMGICFECRVTIDGVPHQRSCQILCAPGLSVTSTERAAAADTGAQRRP
ncbi:MAG TPA: 2Fe-2S iron-sulfur cluster-binding protein [Acidobacteriaceae bacterium]|jgi:D-hydroxyproline dehydrogenase subunit gamma|nr:2Fe-2S iron-sulfur cluster-binding protein [Acidobacteriaceae bacterium]